MSTKSTDRTSAPCPCDSGQLYGVCCAPLHTGTPAASAEALMRSRYSAYVMRMGDYLLSSWHPKTRPPAMDFNPAITTRWLGLEIVRHAQTNADNAVVEYIARWREGGHRAQKLHEISKFQRVDGNWFYLSGDILPQ